MSFLELAAGMIDKLPQIMQMFYTIGFVVLMWVFGNTAVKFFKKKMGILPRYGFSFAIGFVIVFCASAMNNVFVFASGGLFDMLRINLMINGVIATVIFSIALYLVSKDRKEDTPSKIIADLNSRIDEMKTALTTHKIKVVSQEDAKKKAFELVKGYSVKSASMREGKWDILLENLDKKKANVFIDPYDGSYEIVRDEPRIKSNPAIIVGIALILGIVIFSLFSFKGFQQVDFSEMAEDLGIPAENARMLFEDKNITEGCVSAISIMARYGLKMDELETHESEDTKSMIEKETGEEVLMMYIAPYEGKDYIMAISLPKDVDVSSDSQQEIAAKTNVCIATEDKFCDCLK